MYCDCDFLYAPSFDGKVLVRGISRSQLERIDWRAGIYSLFAHFLCTSHKTNRNASSCDEIFAKHFYRYHFAIKQIGANFQRQHLNTFPFFE